MGKNKKPDSDESGLARDQRLLSAVARFISRRPSSPSRPVPTCAFDRRHTDVGNRVRLEGTIHWASEMVMLPWQRKRILPRRHDLHCIR
jgi:hypothetical protein